MKNMEEYVAMLKCGLSFLSYPFSTKSRMYCTSDGELFSPIRKENEMSFILPCTNGNILESLRLYNADCENLINECECLRTDLALQDRQSSHFLEKFLELQKIQETDSFNLVHFNHYHKMYFQIIKRVQSRELESEYADFCLNWHSLFDVVFKKKNELLNGVQELLCINNMTTEVNSGSYTVIDEKRRTLLFPRKFSPIKAKKICNLLIQHNFIAPTTTTNDFTFFFSLSSENRNVKPIKWIKLTCKVKNNKVSKASLIDFLTLLGYTQREIIGEDGEKYKRLNNCFEIENNSFKPNDFSTKIKKRGVNQALDIKSEYHEQLVGILNSANYWELT